MTLILTELSQVGIAMAADSAISYYEPNGNIRHIDHKGWQKLLWVPRIRAGVSYWGFVGKVTAQRFDEWLGDRIASQSYQDLRSLANFLAAELNSKCNNQPLGSNQCVGIHIAGYQPWADGALRPTFYHVHNGHGHIEYGGAVAVPARGINGQPIQRLLPTNPTWAWDPRGLFQVNDDFLNHNLSLTDNIMKFNRGPYLTRNGDIGHYILIGDALREVSICANTVPGLSIPSDPMQLAPRMGFLKMEIETTAMFYRCSTLSRIIGGKVTTLGIRPDGTRV